MDILLLAVPFISSTLMFAIKAASGLFMTDNGPTTKPWLRGILILVTFIGVVAGHFLNGTPLDSTEVSGYVQALIETGLLSYFAHAFYNSAFRR